MYRNSIVAALIAAIFTNGCTSLPVEVKQVTDARTSEIQKGKKSLSEQVKPASGAVERIYRPKLAGDVVVVDPKKSLPDLFDRKITYMSYSEDIGEVISSLSSTIGVPMRVVNKLTTASTTAAASSSTQDKAFVAEYRNESVRNVLDKLALRFDTNWRWKNSVIEFYAKDTESFQIALPRGSRSMTGSVSLSGSRSGGSGGSSSGGGSSGGGSNGASVSVSSTITLDTFKAALEGIASIVTAGDNLTTTATGSTSAPSSSGSSSTSGGSSGSNTTSLAGGNVVGNIEMGMVTVTATPATLKRVGSYLDAINNRFAQNVLIQVRVLDVTLDNAQNASLSIGGLLTAGMGSLGITAAPVLSTASGTPSVMTFTGAAGGKLDGVTAVASILSKFGDVSLSRQGQVLAANGQPSAMQVANQVNYLASSSTTTAATVGSTTSLQPGTATIGFTASFLPMVMGDNRILLDYSINLSTLLSMTTVASGGQSIQTPQIATQSLQHQAYVRDGETIVLFGFEQDRLTADKVNGLVSIGGGASKIHQMQVIIMDVTRTNGGGHV